MRDKAGATPNPKEVANRPIGSDKLQAKHAEMLAEIARLPEMNPGPVVRVDGDGTVRLANSAAREVFGDQIVGCNWLDTLPELDDRDWKGILNATDPVPIESRIEDRYLVFSHRRDLESDLVFVFGADITRQKKAEADHAAALERIARFPEMNPGPVLRIKGDGTVRLANSAARDVFGKDIAGCNWLDLVPTLDEDHWKRILQAAEPVRIESRIGDCYFVFAHRRDFESDLVFVFGADITLQKKAEADLRVYSHIVSASTDFVSLVDRDYVYRVINRSYLDAMGKKPEEIVGHAVAEILGEDFFESSVKPHLDRALDGEPENFQAEVDFAVRGQRILDVRCDPFRDTKGQVTGVLVDARDITEEKQAERALREADELVRLLLNSTGEGIYGIDLAGNCTFANPAAAEVLGFDSVDDLLGKQMHMLIHHTRVNGEPYPVEECRIYQAFHKGEGTHVEDEVMFRADGKPFPCEYWSYPMIRDKELLGCVVTFVDITERQRVENELRQTEKMSALGKLSAGLAHELNNPAAAASRAADQLRQGIDDLQSVTIELARLRIEPATWDLLTDALEEIRNRAKTLADLSPLEATDREEELLEWLEQHDVDESWMIAPIFVNVGIEIKDLDELAGKLKAVPLRLVMVWICRIITAADLAHVVERSSRSISELVNIVKSYSHMDKAPSLFVDIHDGLEDTLAIMHHKLKRGVEVVRDYDRDIPQVKAQGNELNQVWTNLLDNAVSAMDGKGTINIRTYFENGLAKVAISDTGPGIPEDIRHRIFEPFFTTKDVGEGTGLGLDVVNRIVKNRCGGRIDLESTPGGTTFRVAIPVSIDCATEDSEAPAVGE